MTIVRATLKALLKSTPKMKRLPQEQAEDMPIISRFNGTLPQAIDTWEIRKYVHKGSMNVSNFFGILKIQHKSMNEILQSLTVKKLLAKYPSLTLTESFFGLNQTVIAGALYGSLAHEYCKLLANHISNKQKGHIHGRIIKWKVSWSKIHGATEQESVSVNLIRFQKEDYDGICKALQVIYGKDSANRD